MSPTHPSPLPIPSSSKRSDRRRPSAGDRHPSPDHDRTTKFPHSPAAAGPAPPSVPRCSRRLSGAQNSPFVCFPPRPLPSPLCDQEHDRFRYMRPEEWPGHVASAPVTHEIIGNDLQYNKRQKQHSTAAPRLAFYLSTPPPDVFSTIGHPSLRIQRRLLPAHLIHCLPTIRSRCEAHALTLPSQWVTNLYSLTRCDVPLREVDGGRLFDFWGWRIADYLRGLVEGMCKKKMKMDRHQPHVLKYSTDGPAGFHRGVRLHHDKCDFTVNLMMSRKEEYEGGGTYFSDVDETVHLNFGEFIIHPGHLLHSGVDIKKGTRYIMVLFLNAVK